MLVAGNLNTGENEAQAKRLAPFLFVQMTTRDFKLWGKFGARRMKGVNFHPKRCGEIAELAFAFKACGMGFVVSKPYGDSAAYDFVVGAKKHLRRVQVKSTSRPGSRSLQCGSAAL